METVIVSARAKGEYVQAIYQRYRLAARPDKQRILDEFCAVTGHHRKHAIRVLNAPAPGASRELMSFTSRGSRFARACGVMLTACAVMPALNGCGPGSRVA